MINFILSLFKPFRWLIERSGADYDQFMVLLKLKLTIDDRQTRGLMKTNTKSHEKMLVKQFFSQVFVGLVFLLFLVPIKSQFTYFYFSHLMVMVMMAMMIISEFTTILFDTSENDIIQPLPIKGNTIGLVRNAHVFIYLGFMAFNLSFGALVVSIIKFGFVAGGLFIATIALNTLLTLFLSNIIYLGIMRVASGERLKNVLMYFQIVFAIGIMATYQLGLNVIDKNSIANMILPVYWYTFLIPPAFFSGFVEAVSKGILDLNHLIFIAETAVMPFVAVWISGRYLNPKFTNKLLELEQGDRSSEIKNVSARESVWYRIMAFFFVRKTEERASFRLIWKMVGRERMFKQTLFPSIGYVVFFIFFPAFKKGFTLSTLAESNKFVFVLYVFLFAALTIPTALLVGNNRHQSWIFKAIPLATPASFFKGAIKAAFARFFIPMYAVVVIGVIYIWGIHVVPDIVIAFLATYFLVLLVYYYQNPNYPFSSEKKKDQGGMAILKMFGMLLLIGALGAFHWFLLSKWFRFANLLLLPIYAIGIAYINRNLVHKKINWEKVDLLNPY